jgi:ligand-binding sensor domain-containing protein/signal transduction histidine kinase/ActR/RegA family two-component response regulator
MFCFVWLTCPAYALDPAKSFSQYRQTIWNTENGLPTNLAVAMTQTRDGYLWFATQEGLARFNGISFKVFDSETAPTLKSSQITSLLEDGAGRLWAGTFKGLHLYKDGAFVAFSTENGLSKDYVSALYEDRGGDLWIGTSAGLNRMRDGVITVYGAKDGLTGERIRDIGEDADGNLWIGTAGGLFLFATINSDYSQTSDGLPADSIRRIYLDTDGALRIGTDGGLSQLSGERFVSDWRFAEKPFGHQRDRENCLWAGGDFGLSRVNGDTVTTLEGGTYSIFFDVEGGLWFSTEGEGVRHFTDGKFTTYTTSENLSGDIAFSIAQNQAGDVWVSTNKGISRRRGNAFDFSLMRQKELPDDRIVAVLSGNPADDLWIGTTKGLLRWHNDKLVDVAGSEYLRKKLVQAFYRDRENNLWIGTSGGLSRFDEQLNGGEIVNYDRFKQLANANIYSITGSLSNGLWIGTLRGLLFLKDDKLTVYTTKDGLAHDIVMSLYDDAAGALWIGTYGGGLSRFKDGKFASVTVRDGLFNGIVYAILPDEAGNLWMSCNRGIFRVAKSNLDEFMDGARPNVESVVYGAADGMKSFETNGGFQPAALKARDGKLWFPTVKGVAVIDPNNIEINRLPPPVHVENLIADGEAAEFGEKTVLDAGAHRLEFRFAALTFAAPEKVRFRYRLEGYDTDWIDSGNRREAFYTNLPHGDYLFRVIAANSDGVWNETGASYALRIKPFFYQTWWFVLFCIVGASGLLTALHFLRVRQLQLRHAAVLDERTRIARELHDTLLQGFVGVSSQLSAVAAQFQPAPEIAERHLDVARKMIRHSVTEARRALQNLRAVEPADADFNRSLRETVERVGEGQPQKIEFETIGTTFKILPETKQQILRIAEEATLNSIKHAEAEAVKIVLTYNAPAVKLEVADDGRGFDVKNSFSTLNGHFGLLGMKERAEKAGGQLYVQSVMPGGTQIIFENKRAAVKTKSSRRTSGVEKNSERYQRKAMKPLIRILLVEDHLIARIGINTIISVQPDMVVVGEAVNGRQGVELYRQHQPDIALMDLRMAEMDGAEALQIIRGEFRHAKIIIFSSRTGDAEIARLLRLGASGYVLKDVLEDELIKAIRQVHAGKKYIPVNVAQILAEHLGEGNAHAGRA